MALTMQRFLATNKRQHNASFHPGRLIWMVKTTNIVGEIFFNCCIKDDNTVRKYKANSEEKPIIRVLPFLFFNEKKFFYCCSITVVCIFSPPLHPTPAKPTSLPCHHPPPRFCPCVLYSSSWKPLSPLCPPHSPLAIVSPPFFLPSFWVSSNVRCQIFGCRPTRLWGSGNYFSAYFSLPFRLGNSYCFIFKFTDALLCLLHFTIKFLH